jgi:hypothetical protein
MKGMTFIKINEKIRKKEKGNRMNLFKILVNI